MKIFLDTEFTGLHRNASLISIGLAAGNGDVFYGELTGYAREQLNPWITDNVLPALSGDLPNAGVVPAAPIMLCQGDLADMGEALRSWLNRFGGKNSVEIWADVLAWDWILFCDVFGGAMALPEQVHYIPRDLSTLLWVKGIDPDIKREELGTVAWKHPKLHLRKHHALYDALLEKSVFENL